MPPEADQSQSYSLALALCVLFAAGFLGWRQWREASNRPADLSPADASYFNRQDLRRLVGTIVLIMLGLALAFGGGLSPKVNGRVNVKFFQLWSGVVFLILIILILATLDWISTRLYARRRIHELAREGIALVEQQLRLKAEIHRREHGGNGHYRSDELP